MGQKTKLIGQMFKIQKEIGRLETTYEDKGIEVAIRGGGFISSPKITKLQVGEAEIRDIIEVLNQALKKAHGRAIKKLQEIGGGLPGMV